jgi:hypothetical protein
MMSQLSPFALASGLLLAAATATVSGSAQAGAVVSNNQKETRKGANYYAGNAALDGQAETAWLLPGDSENVGEYIIIDIPRVNIDKLAIQTGWQRDEDTFADYARVKKISLEASYMNATNELVPAPKVLELEVKDEMGWQFIDFEDLVVEEGTEGGKVKITIQEVYPGKDFPQAAIIDLVLHLGEFDSKPKVSDPSTEDEGAIAALVDGNTRSAWMAPAGNASFSVRGTGTMLSSLDMTFGPATHARPKTLKLTVKNRTETVELPNSAGPHHVVLPATVGYTGTWDKVMVEVVDVHPGKTHADKVAIAEIAGKATALDGL